MISGCWHTFGGQCLLQCSTKRMQGCGNRFVPYKRRRTSFTAVYIQSNGKMLLFSFVSGFLVNSVGW